MSSFSFFRAGLGDPEGLLRPDAEGVRMYGVLVPPVVLEATKAAKLAVLTTGGDVNCFRSCGDVCWCDVIIDADVDEGDAGPLRTSLMMSAGVVLLKPPERASQLKYEPQHKFLC